MITARPSVAARFRHPTRVMGNSSSCAINAGMSTIGRMRV
jgi:hypothetical protein